MKEDSRLPASLTRINGTLVSVNIHCFREVLEYAIEEFLANHPNGHCVTVYRDGTIIRNDARHEEVLR